MFKSIQLLIITIGMFVSWVCQAGQEPLLTPEQIKSDIALAREAYERIHPGYDRYTDLTTLDREWQRIIDEALVSRGLTVGDFYLTLQRTLAAIHCDHTKAELPDVLAQRRRGTPTYLPFQWVWIEGRGFVTFATEASGVSLGDEILTIDGRPLGALVSEVIDYIPYDGATEWARRGGVSSSREFLGGAVDHFGDLLWGNGAAVELELADANGERKTLTADRIPFGEWRGLDAGTGPAANFVDGVHFETIDDNAGYLRIDTFVNYRRPIDPDELYSPIFKRLAEEGRDTLILDLRQNGGGSNDAANRLIAHLITEPTQLKTEIRVKTLNLDGLRPHLSSWDSRALNPPWWMFRKNDDGSYSMRNWFNEDTDRIKPAENAFKGQLLILTSDENASGSTNVIALLKGLGRATLVGEPTGGSAEGTTAGILLTLSLPESGIRTRIPMMRGYNNVPSFEPGLGVEPDVMAPMTVEAWRAGEDPALERAKMIARRRGG